MKEGFAKKNRKRYLTLFFVLIFIVTCTILSSKVKTKGYSGLWDFVSTVSSNYWKGTKANPESISIEIDDKEYKHLEKNRNAALERGVIINELDGDYVPATLEYQNKKIKIKLRLKGHMTDHLQDNKWSFRIKIKGNDSFMGMKRFSIQHPGTRGYVYEWIYHELMKREDIIALRYKFINVTVNGRDWGIYAVEENFENELIENNNRKKGPILRFNPDLYWVNRYSMMQKSSSADEFASYYSANPEAYAEDKVLKDSTQKMYYLKAIALIEGLRNKKLTVPQVFDVDRLAKFHAIIDLVGGDHSVDWSDIKYYYNPVSAKLEPVAYESFTDFTTRDIAGAYKYVQLDSNDNFEDWHKTLFSNPEFFRAYIKQLEKISEASYLDSFFDESNIELQKNLAIIYKEFPYKKFDKQGYYRNQKMIKKILSAAKSFHAYFNSVSNNEIHIQLGAIESLPVEIKSLSIGDNKSVLPIKPIVLAAKQRKEFVNFSDYIFVLPSGIRWNDSLISNLSVRYSVLGSQLEKETKVFPFPHTDTEFISNDLKNKQATIASFSFLEVDEIKKTIYIKPGAQTISSDLIVPKGYRFLANLGVSLDIKNGAKIISYSPLIFEGTEEKPLVIESSDSTSQGIEVVCSTNRSTFKYVVFKNLPKINDTQWNRTGALTFYESAVEFTNCSFYNCKAEDVVNLIRSKFLFKECFFENTHDDALDADFSEGNVSNCAFENCSENALDLDMCKITVKSIAINGAGNKALNIKAGTQLKGSDVKIKNANIAVSAEDLSEINLNNVDISDSKIGIVAYKNKPGAGHPKVVITGLVMKHVDKNYLREKKSTIVVNGNDVKEDVDNVEAIIKDDKKKHK